MPTFESIRNNPTSGIVGPYVAKGINAKQIPWKIMEMAREGPKPRTLAAFEAVNAPITNPTAPRVKMSPTVSGGRLS